MNRQHKTAGHQAPRTTSDSRPAHNRPTFYVALNSNPTDRPLDPPDLQQFYPVAFAFGAGIILLLLLTALVLSLLHARQQSNIPPSSPDNQQLNTAPQGTLRHVPSIARRH